MNIAFLAHDKKKELMVQFCTAYKSVLMKHDLFATATTGRLIADNTGLNLTLLLSHKQGGHQQINARIAYNEIDLVLLFTDPNTTDPWDDSQMIETIRYCDKHNVPIATNLASAEMLIMGLRRGDLDWREMLHSKTRYPFTAARTAGRFRFHGGKRRYGNYQAPDPVRLYGTAARQADSV